MSEEKEELDAANAWHPYAATAREYLERWDKGEAVWTLEMGGIGPGYEQAIQVLVTELLRDNLDKPLPDEDSWRSWGDDVVSRIDATAGGFSGAQVGAAKGLAVRYLQEGPRAFFERVKGEMPSRGEDLILVSNAWPHVEVSTANV